MSADRDQLRQQIAEVLAGLPGRHLYPEDVLNAVLPAMEAHTALTVANELIYAAKSVHHSEDQEGYRWMTYRAAEWSATAPALGTHEGETQ